MEQLGGFGTRVFHNHLGSRCDGGKDSLAVSSHDVSDRSSYG